MSLVAAPWVRVHVLLPALSACTLERVPHTLLLAALAVTTVVRTYSSRSHREELKADPVIEVYAVVQSLAIAEVCACRMLVAGLVCLVRLATVGACASGILEIVGSVPIVVAGKMQTVHGHAAVEACCFANCSVDLRMNVQSVDRGAASVLREVVEAAKTPDLSPAAVDQGTCLVVSLGDIEHSLR